MNTTDYIKLENKYCAHNYFSYPVVIKTGKGVYVTDVEGKTYIDMLSAYSALNQGHMNENIKLAIINQLDKISITSRGFYNENLGIFCEKLAKLCKKDKILPMNSGAEAVETALKVARKWGEKIKGVQKNNSEIIVCRNNFHGRTISIVSMSTEDQYKDGFGPFTPGFKVINYNDTEALKTSINENTVAFLVEPIQGEGGILLPNDGYLKTCYDICKANNVLLIADEIQTGLGRTGYMFACDYESVVPDIYILGKALSGGFYPISVIAANDEIMSVMTPGDHGSTYGGNPLACAIGIASLDTIIDNNLVEKSKILGSYFIERLKSIKSTNIKEIRGRGLMIGVEIKKECGTAKDFILKLIRMGLLAKDTHEQTIRFAPPLIITKEQIDEAMNIIVKIL